MKINTKFGTLYIARGGFGYQLLDSKGIDMYNLFETKPKTLISALKKANTIQEFFNTLNKLTDEIGIWYGTNKKEIVNGLYEEIKDYEERNNYEERTTKKLVSEVINNCANRIGKYYALCSYWNYF